MRRKVETVKIYIEKFETTCYICDLKLNKELNSYMRAGIKNDAKLKEEYVEKMQKLTYRVPYLFESQHYTGDDAKDSTIEDWNRDSMSVIQGMIKSNPETKAKIVNETCSLIVKSYLAKRNLMKEIIQQYKDDMFIEERIDEFTDFYADMLQAKEKNVSFDRHSKTVQSLYSYLEKENRLAMEWEFNRLKQDSSINSDNDRYAKAISKYFENHPSRVKTHVQEWISHELENRTTAEDRLNQKIDALASFFNRRIDDVAKRILTEDDIKKIINYETGSLRNKVKSLNDNVNMLNAEVLLNRISPGEERQIVNSVDISWEIALMFDSKPYRIENLW